MSERKKKGDNYLLSTTKNKEPRFKLPSSKTDVTNLETHFKNHFFNTIQNTDGSKIHN